MTSLLSTAYWPNLHYFYYIFSSESFCVEQFENYEKQSYRNRTKILTSNGVLSLSIPVIHSSEKILIKDLRISYAENWQINHWRAITSAYKNSPYFDFFEEDICSFYANRFETLLEFNNLQLIKVFELLRIKKNIKQTTSFEKIVGEHVIDLRFLIHPKIEFKQDQRACQLLEKPYYQTFQNKFEFQPNLSVLDLLFNKGLETLDYFDV
jgi:hypothetical protein